MDYGIGIKAREKIINVSKCTTYNYDPAALEELYPTRKSIEVPMILAPGNWKRKFNRTDAVGKAIERAIKLYFEGGDWKGYLEQYKGGIKIENTCASKKRNLETTYKKV